MSKGIFIFTFSPIQPFISESRRAADLFTSSQILVRLARSSAKKIEEVGGNLIYPTNLSGDVPNKLVAEVDFDKAETLGNEVKEALQAEWQSIAKTAKDRLAKGIPKPDEIWKNIWERQVNATWEVYWAVAEMQGEDYKTTIRLANQALESVKRTRTFEGTTDANLETGFKDSLSGKRSSLHTKDLDGRGYWVAMADSINDPAKLRPKGNERLDAIGAIKRFCDIADAQFPSTSSMATADYVGGMLLDEKGKKLLGDYNNIIDKLGCFRAHSGPVWFHDGDLFYPEMLEQKQLESNYGIATPDPDKVKVAKEILKEIYKIAGPPSRYYALITLDGDSMGEAVCSLDRPGSEALTKKLDGFSKSITKIISGENVHKKVFQARIIYNGGDDVMAMAPISQAVWFAKLLADQFFYLTGISTSAGIAICHHQSPLSTSLRMVREAETQAKKVPAKKDVNNKVIVNGKSAVCVSVIKRSGVPYQVTSHWVDLVFSPGIVELFEDNQLSSKFAYDVIDEARTVAYLPVEAQAAMLKRLIHRHKLDPNLNEQTILNMLMQWSNAIYWKDSDANQDLAIQEVEFGKVGLEILGKWLVLARFIAQGGKEG
jgi:CRISPR-associated protein Cmr2